MCACNLAAPYGRLLGHQAEPGNFKQNQAFSGNASGPLSGKNQALSGIFKQKHASMSHQQLWGIHRHKRCDLSRIPRLAHDGKQTISQTLRKHPSPNIENLPATDTSILLFSVISRKS